MKKRYEILAVFCLFCLLEIVFWYWALLPDRTFFLRDLSLEIVPKRAFWVHSGGFALWNPLGFFGIPYAANPQSEAFYPFNFFYLLFGAERGLVFYIVFHHLLFLFTFYLAFRELGFGLESSLVSALSFAFGGFFCSLTILVVLLSTVAWFPLVILVLSRAWKQNWFWHGLLLGPLVGMQFLAGEVEMALMGWGLAVLAVALAPGHAFNRRAASRMTAALGVGIFWGAVLSCFQLALTLQMIPLSNRASGFSLEDALAWSVRLRELKSIVLANYIIPAPAFEQRYGVYWGIGFFSEFPYFFSCYAGIIVLLLAVLSTFRGERRRIFFWLSVLLFGLVMVLGEQIPVYRFFYRVVPGFDILRMPVKFLYLFNFGLVSMAALGWEACGGRSRKRLGWSLLACGLVLLLVLVIFPVRLEELARNAVVIERRFLVQSVLKTLCFLVLGAGLVALTSPGNKSRVGLVLALLIFADLFYAHRWLNPAVDRNFYKTLTRGVRVFVEEHELQTVPVRVLPLSRNEDTNEIDKVLNPLATFTGLWNELEGFMPVYFRLNSVRAYSSFHPADILAFNELVAKAGVGQRRMIFNRAGIEYVFAPSRGFIFLGNHFPRAAVFYHARAVGRREQIFALWAEPDFPGQRTLLLEGADTESDEGGQLKMSEPARVAAYENERVVVEAEAREDGWLLLLDSYYPGWRAEVDGTAAEIYRANGFFRAVRVPAGRHKVVFDFHPGNFYRGLAVSGLGFLVWVGMMLFCFRIRRSSR